MIRRLLFTAALGLAVLGSGCAVNRATATVDPSLNWDAVKTLHVKKLDADDRGIHTLIADKLRARGFATTADPQPSPQVDAVVTYADRWMWDLTMYMLELTVTVRDPKSDFPLATGNSLHTSLSRKSPKEMVDEVIDNILKGRK